METDFTPIEGVIWALGVTIELGCKGLHRWVGMGRLLFGICSLMAW